MLLGKNAIDRCFDSDMEEAALLAQDYRNSRCSQAAKRTARALRPLLERRIVMAGLVERVEPGHGADDIEGIGGYCRYGTLRRTCEEALDQQQAGDQHRNSAARHSILQ